MMWFYAAMMGLTAIAVFDGAGKPRSAGEWLGAAGMITLWPATFAYTLYQAIKRGGL